MNFSATLPDLAATQAFAARMAHALQAPLAIGLVGDLGAGKTALVRALIQKLAPGTRVKSPTYTLIESYELTGLQLHHLDLYRIRHPAELAELGLAELASGDAVLLIEWPDRGGDQIPTLDVVATLTREADEARALTLSAATLAGEAFCERLAIGQDDQAVVAETCRLVQKAPLVNGFD
ncbi:MAG: tRNA (adenosine(37)-N6)-threonylcarbamoyltransferase complex ATPase subunit type 1 TsaE [Xanthomonadales bacterium]|nr:tRNA (adenosine(37)-N6)-threonylcarbamoyltransferase complex ATPase subunit type 1 TsaE [Xanthomonadales bacterium]